MLNVVNLQGRIVAEPELKRTQSDISVLSFTIAVDRDYTPKGQDKQTDFIDCTAWRQTAEFVSKYFHKGDLILVQGSIQTRSYEDKNGNRRKAVEIQVDKAHFCGSKKDKSSDGDSIGRNEPQPNMDVDDELADDLPF